MSPGPSIPIIIIIRSEKETISMEFVLWASKKGATELWVTLDKLRETIGRFLEEQMEPGGSLVYFST